MVSAQTAARVLGPPGSLAPDLGRTRRCNGMRRARPAARAQAREPVQQTAARAAEPRATPTAALETLAAATDKSLDVEAVHRALLEVEQAELQPGADWPAVIGGASSPGRSWRLLFSASTPAQGLLKPVRGSKPHGSYFPLPAVYSWDASAGCSAVELDLLGGFLGLAASGTYRLKGQVLGFEFNTLTLRLAGLGLPINLKPRREPSAIEDLQAGLHFRFLHMDDRILVARGRSGGIALWVRAEDAEQRRRQPA